MKKIKFYIPVLLVSVTLILSACGASGQSHAVPADTLVSGTKDAEQKVVGFAKTGEKELYYATQYSIEEYGVYDLITIVDSGRFLLVPEGEAVPEAVPADVTCLKQPLNRTYLVSTSAMDLIQTTGALSDIRLSGTKEEYWYIDAASEAMKKKEILYAGKYSAPDYELILREGCNLAIENTMIYHNPEVKEKLEQLGIPVLVERSSYEEHPLGRLEWIRLYGVLFGKEEEADAWYEKQLEKIDSVMNQEPAGKRVAFFSVTSNGSVTVRKPKDYISQMIGLAGGSYILDNRENEEDNALSTMKLQIEDFYVAAKDADILIYNSTIEGELETIQDLTAKNALFSDFKAVKEGKVYCTGSDFFQRSTGIGDFIADLNHVITDDGTEEFTFLKKLR